MNGARDLSLVFAAGAVGALANSVAAWLFGALGITGAFGVAIAPALTPEWLYPRLVWGGLWGVLFLLPVLRGRWFGRGLLLSLGPSAGALFVVLPLKAGAGIGGVGLGALAPAFVLLFNAVWGVTAAGWLEIAGRGGAQRAARAGSS